MKLTRIVGMLLVLAMIAPMFAIGQEAAPPNATAVAVAEVVAQTASDKAAEVATEATVTVADKAIAAGKEAVASGMEGAKDAVANAVAAVTPGATAKEKMLDALLGFLDVSKNALEDGVGLMKDGAVAAGQFAGTQIPLVLTELITLRRVEVLAKLLMTLGVGLLGFFIGRKLWKWVNDPENKELKGSDAEGMFALVGLVLQAISVIVPIIIIANNMREWALPWFAPRIYLIEYTVKLIEKLQG